MKNKYFTHLCCIFFLITYFRSPSQQFLWQAQLDTPRTNGWYKIILPATVTSLSSRSLCDLRIFDSKNTEIAYDRSYQNLGNSINDTAIYVPVTNEFFEIENDSIHNLSILKFKFQNEQCINRIFLTINSPSYYYREANMYTKKESVIKGKRKMIKERITSFTINSKIKPVFNLHDLYTDNFTIEIENNNNTPLEITAVSLAEIAPLIIASLKGNEAYHLRFGDDKLKSPTYDISHFIDRNIKMSYLNVLNVESTVTTPLTTEPKEIIRFWQSAWFLWSCITIVAIILILFTVRIVADMQQK